MRNFLKFLGFCALLFATILYCPCLEAKELTQRDVATLITEYLGADTPGNRQTEILAELKTANPILAQETLKKSLVDDKQINASLKLAIELRVPGLFETVKKCVGTVDGDLAIKYLFVIQDKKSLDFLFDYLMESNTEDAAFLYVTQGFKTCYISDIQLLDKLYGKVDDKTYGETAKDILCFQLGIVDKDLDYLKKNWKKLREELVKITKTITVTGTDLLLLPDLKLINARKAGRNYYISDNGSVLTPNLADFIQTGSFTLKARVYINDGEGFFIGLCYANGRGWEVDVKGNEWILKAGEGQAFAAPLKRDDWNLIEFCVTDNSTPAKRCMRTGEVLVNGKKFAENLSFNGEFGYLVFKTTKGCAAVGGVEVIKK
ncbi:MAG: hypothetical protein V1701_03780 [Planctomycetota bacterium]